MTLLLNLLVPLVLSLIALVSYWRFTKAEDDKSRMKVTIVGLITSVVFLFVYSMVQPSYLPKGGVPDMKRVPITVVKDIPIENRLLLPQRTPEESHKHNIETFDAVRKAEEILNN